MQLFADIREAGSFFDQNFSKNLSKLTEAEAENILQYKTGFDSLTELQFT